MHPALTRHAEHRAAQANLTQDKINIILQFGRWIHRGHALFCVLLKRDLPHLLQGDDYFLKLTDCALVMDPSGSEIITCYKNKTAIKNIKRKK